MKQDEVSDVLQVGFLGFATEMPKEGCRAQAREEFRLRWSFHDAGCGKSLSIGVLSSRCRITPYYRIDRKRLTTTR